MKPLILITSVALLLGGCSLDSKEVELMKFMSDVRKSPSGKIAPLPEVPEQVFLTYDGSSLRDPFSPVIRDNRQSVAVDEKNIMAFKSRKREYLESFPLEHLRPVGTVAGMHNQLQAIFRTPKGEIYTVAKGHYVGTNHGEIMEIHPDHIIIKETLRSGNRTELIERERILRISEG
jgi:type IV pilus assembly protein PilP